MDHGATRQSFKLGIALEIRNSSGVAAHWHGRGAAVLCRGKWGSHGGAGEELCLQRAMVIQNRGAMVALPADEGKWGVDERQWGGLFYRCVHRAWMGWHRVAASAQPRSGSVSAHARA
jgi:hypothetical protein